VEGARPATPDDVPRLAELNRQALAEQLPLRGGAVFVAREARAEPLEGALAAALDDPNTLLLAGTIDDTPIGYAVAHVEDLRDGTRLGVITDIYVEAEGRGVGVGECLMDRLLAWFTERECNAADAHALPGDRSTKNFFEGSGFSARLLVMHHKMAGSDDAV
jgi:ribosomal protein S18 acetylase RimI-like enzyme